MRIGIIGKPERTELAKSLRDIFDIMYVPYLSLDAESRLRVTTGDSYILDGYPTQENFTIIPLDYVIWVKGSQPMDFMLQYFKERDMLIEINCDNTPSGILAKTVVALSKNGSVKATNLLYKLLKGSDKWLKQHKKA